MQRQNLIRVFLFMVFFSIGAATLSSSILCDDLLRYYNNRQVLKRAEGSLEQLKSLNADYGALLQQLGKDPNFVKRIGPATLGTKPAETDVVYPEVTSEQLAAARKVLAWQLDQQSADPITPEWLIRCSEPRRRIILFLAGAFLILISFIWFGSTMRAG